MKIKYFYHACFLMLTTATGYLLSACSDYLKVEPKSSYDEKYVFDNVANTTSAVLGVYNALTGDQGYGGRLNFFYPLDTDEMLGGNNSAPGGGDNGSRSMARYNTSPGNTQLEAPFSQLYSGVERANICIKNIPEMALYENGTENEKRQLQRLYGEVLTLRAQFYLELIRNWGDVPAQFEPSYVLTDLFLEKTDRDVIYDHVLEDLKLAATLVPWRNEGGIANDERITKGAVKALRAKIALFRGGYSLRTESNLMERRVDYLTYYQIARDECKEIIESSKHALNPSFLALFKDNFDAHVLEPNGEVVFEVALAGGTGIADGRAGNIDGPRTGASTGGGNCLLTPTYFYAFDSLDTRRDVTAAPYTTNISNFKIGAAISGINSGKFRRDWISNPSVPLEANTLYHGVNWPLIRYSDVLLMFAEADNEINNGPSAAAITAFETVRKRAFAGNLKAIGTTPAGKEGFFNAIVNERSFEFGGEGIRKYDLLRWNLLETKIKEARANLTRMKDKVAPYDKLPQYVYYKSSSTTLIYYSSFYKPAPGSTPTGYARANWVINITPAYITNVAELFEPNQKELMPFPQAAINSNPKLKQNFGY
ncbi:RagB/SusD family nutrient uptake outer membrane protein [Dyadobacter psychrotolerans]|uniref:RagB/SusD family nutrient uptake outer membrane protein n=1 Tax=Dyadobacter psychrotolerans TaxID=2541721 RepID=A0A4R5DT26_9BACT|nr:RagB/SusD family nutrient uptake outer membrane protein [Dyadobacter psychrotolerans]TDE15420.1 RagB/SusD family nutrient uptake outer membrane protein [Dyadobacter psychrotolerans]